jgi:hypothetical protein
MEPRLKAGIWVKALIRRADLVAAGVAVVARGDGDAGAVVLKFIDRARACQVLTQARGRDGERLWLRACGKDPVAETEADAYIARQRGRDPDLWVVEIENAAPALLLDDPIV